MLGCIQPMSSPMMKRMLGFCPWAEAGMLAIVVTEHNTTSALQIVLNTFMIASPMSAADAGPQRFTPLDPPTVFAFKLDHSGNRSDALVAKLAEVSFGLQY
jgi:hypothetical protein